MVRKHNVAKLLEADNERILPVDFQAFTDNVLMPCCVISVEQTAEGGCGEIRIVCANAAYKETMGPAYYDNMIYYELVPQDNKFEDFCFRSAVLGQRMHAYVETKAMDCWTDQTLIPLAEKNGNLNYCQFIFEFTKTGEADRMADVSVETAEAIIRACIVLMGTDNFQESVGNVLEDLMNFSEAEASRIMLVDHRRREAVNFCERIKSGRWENRASEGEVISYDLIRTWESLIGVSNAVIVKDEQDMEQISMQNPGWAASMREHGVTSLVLIPLRRSGAVIGYLYVVNFNVEIVLQVKELVELLSFFLASEICNHQLLERLDEMSHTDGLTGLNNRNAMIRRIHELQQNQPESVGIINLDLNGLKTVNDFQGHDAGDRLLVQAGELLRKFFYHEDLYRTGGDEFVVIIGNISRETFNRKLERFRSSMTKNSEISFAIGDYWSDGTTDLTTAFRFADERMYSDKDAFYKSHPEKRRRR